MGTYSLWHGQNEQAPYLLSLIGMNSPDWLGRFRDIHLNGDGTQVRVLTRNGGNNRKCINIANGKKDCGAVDCFGCIMTHRLPKHPQYLRDEDDKSDSTFGYVFFKIKKADLVATKAMATGKEPPMLREEIEATIKSLDGMTTEELENDPQASAIRRSLKNILPTKDES